MRSAPALYSLVVQPYYELSAHQLCVLQSGTAVLAELHYEPSAHWNAVLQTGTAALVELLHGLPVHEPAVLQSGTPENLYDQLSGTPQLLLAHLW